LERTRRRAFGSDTDAAGHRGAGRARPGHRGPGCQNGRGTEAGQVAARKAAGTTAKAVAVAGFCGAVSPELRAGDVVVATELRTPEGQVIPCSGGPLAAALRQAGVERVHLGPIASLPHIAR